MKRPFSKVVLLLAVVVAGFLGWRLLFPTPERVIRKRLAALAQTASSSSKASGLARAYNSQKVAGYFTTDGQIVINISGFQATLTGREEMLAALMARPQAGGFTVEFGGIEVTVAPDNNSAVVNLTAKVNMPSERDWNPQELKLVFQKIDGAWLISRLETVKTLL